MKKISSAKEKRKSPESEMRKSKRRAEWYVGKKLLKKGKRNVKSISAMFGSIVNTPEKYGSRGGREHFHLLGGISSPTLCAFMTLAWRETSCSIEVATRSELMTASRSCTRGAADCTHFLVICGRFSSATRQLTYAPTFVLVAINQRTRGKTNFSSSKFIAALGRGRKWNRRGGRQNF